MILLLMFVAVFSFTFLTQKFKGDEDVQAANAWAFDPGYIISDWQMGNYQSMSEADIQNFLTRMNPCNNTDWALYDEQSRTYPGVSWHWDNGHFVCMSQEKFGEGTTLGSGQTAAHIIWEAAQKYRINPQVLLVLLEKENGLVTDSFPHSGQYKTATGFACPDTAPCDLARAGFKNQINLAAALYREVLDGGWSNYPVGMNEIKYHPHNAWCGTAWINVQNRATSALYRYTPYIPNNAALGAGYGNGDACSSYGNRNFYMWFEDWFGGIKDEEYAMPASANIEEGVYTIKSTINANKAMDIFDGSKSNNANVQLYDNNNTGAQKWKIKNNNDGTYTLINPQSNKALDVDNASKVRGTNVKIYDQNGSCAQKWRIVDSGNKNYVFYSSCSGMALDVYDASTRNGTNIQIYAPNNTNAQKWKLDKEEEVNRSDSAQIIKEGMYEIQSAINSKKVIDIADGAEGARNGTNLQIYEANNTNAQKWQIKYNDDGTYSILNPTSKLALDVFNADTTSRTNIQVWSQNGSCAQKWKIKNNNDGTYTFVSACSNLVLDVWNGDDINRTNIQLFESNGTKAQKWTLKKI